MSAPGCILVIDDNADTCRILIRCVRALGVVAECLTDPADAMSAVTRLRPRLVFLDYMMPELDGLSVLRLLKSEAPTRDVPVVMFTADDDRGLREVAMRLGAVGLLVKGSAGLDDLRQFVVRVGLGGARPE